MTDLGNLLFIATVLLAIVLTLGLMAFSRRYLRRNPLPPDSLIQPVVVAGGKVSPLFTFLRLLGARLFSRPTRAWKRWFDNADWFGQYTPHLVLLIECAIIVAWAFYAGRELLNLSTSLWHPGQDFPLVIRENYFWRDLTSCGTCALWNGRMNGGIPALIDLLDAPLHPLVVIPTLLFGVINGGKITVVLSLALAGLAQLWLGYTLRFGRVARVWTSLMAVVAGTLVGRMELGLVTMVLSLASCALVIPAGISFSQNRTWRSAIVLAVVSALAVLSGQGYAQLAIALAIFPALLILFVNPFNQFRALVIKLVVAGGLVLLLCGTMLVPLFNNGSKMSKVTDEELQHAQVIEYQPLNLVVNDKTFFDNNVLSKAAAPFLFVNYIGWFPILLAGAALRLVPREKLRMLIFLLAGVLLVYLNSSMIIPKLVFSSLNNEFLVGLRHMPMVTGLAGTLLLGLAGWGLDLALKSDRFVVHIQYDTGTLHNVPVLGLLLGVCMFFSLVSVYEYTHQWLGNVRIPDTTRLAVSEMITPSAQWVEMPQNHAWNLLAYENNIKLTNAFQPWTLKDQVVPGGYIKGSLDLPEDPEATPYSHVGDLYFTEHPAEEYATLKTSAGVVACPATARGGMIDLYCPSDMPGELLVKEHNWSGWSATVDSSRAPIVAGQWLRLYLPAGRHEISFRYFPWDTPTGLLVSLLGIGLTVWLWRKTGPARPTALAAQQSDNEALIPPMPDADR